MTVEAPDKVKVFDRILCGVDESPESVVAARQAARLRSPDGLLRVAAVADVNLAVHAGFAMSHVLGELDASAREVLHQVTDAVHPDSTNLLAGDPVPTLMDAIKRFDATLVAVGPHGHSRALGMVLGGVSTTLLHEARCSVLLARRTRYTPFPSSIVVGVDGSEQSLAAARVALSVAERFGAKLTVAAATGGKRIDLEAIRRVAPYFVIDPGRPVEALVGLAETFDLLVVGSRGLHGVTALGSVSERVAHQASSSVLVVRSRPDEL